jgi:hypothetical protein
MDLEAEAKRATKMVKGKVVAHVRAIVRKRFA